VVRAGSATSPALVANVAACHCCIISFAQPVVLSLGCCLNICFYNQHHPWHLEWAVLRVPKARMPHTGARLSVIWQDVGGDA
jgi:hypothetical protein